MKRKTLNKSEADEVIHSATTTTITPHAAAYQQNTQAEDTPTTSVVVAYPLVDDTVIAAPHKHHEAKWKGIVRHIAACGSLVIYFVSVSGFTVFETIGTPLTEDVYFLLYSHEFSCTSGKFGKLVSCTLLLPSCPFSPLYCCKCLHDAFLKSLSCWHR